MTTKPILAAGATIVLATGLIAAAPAHAAKPIKPVATKAPAGHYKADPAHTSLNFKIEHLGLSRYTARFTHVDIQLDFDPAHPARSSVNASIDAKSLQTNYPDPKALDFDAQIERQFLGADQFPAITFHSTRVQLTGANTARVTGDFTFHGVTHPVILDANFNGGYPAGGMDPSGSRIGFSARGTIKRSDYGVTVGLPPPGTQFGVGDEIEVFIEAELTSPGKAQ